MAKKSAVPVTPPGETEAAQEPLQVTYLANEGFLVEAGGIRVLIDALFGPGIAGYPAVPQATRERIEGGLEEFAGVTLALATHYHGDHFDPAAVARFMAANPRALFVSTPQAVARLESEAPGIEAIRSRLRGVLPPAGETRVLDVAGVRVRALNLHHGRRIPPTENLGFVVTLGDSSFLHLGDTEAKLEGFRPYLGLLRGADVALLPFWFLSSEWRADMVRDEIRPGAIVVAHLPVPDAPAGHFGRWQSYDNLVRVMAERFPEALVPKRSGERWVLDSAPHR